MVKKKEQYNNFKEHLVANRLAGDSMRIFYGEVGIKDVYGSDKEHQEIDFLVELLVSTDEVVEYIILDYASSFLPDLRVSDARHRALNSINFTPSEGLPYSHYRKEDFLNEFMDHAELDMEVFHKINGKEEELYDEIFLRKLITEFYSYE